ncbi:trypsin-like serine protease [Desulfonatronum parangueonense]
MSNKVWGGIVFLLVLLLGVCTPVQSLADYRGSVRIVGGDVVRDPEAYPWMISLAIPWIGDLYDAHDCGATLISPTWALSAAHCFVDDETGEVYDEVDAVLGTLSLKSPSPDFERIPVERLIIHPEYDRFTTDNDIALLKLNRPSSRQPVAKLAASDQDAAPGLMSTVLGWGWTLPKPRSFRSSSSDLLKLNLPIVDNDICAQSMIYADSVITDNMLCAGTGLGGQDSCQGDSGGPLVRSLEGGGHMLVGVVSWGEGCADPDSYGVYARVSRFVDWINSHVDGGLTTDQWITTFYVAYWGRAADPSGLSYWMGEVDRGALDVVGVAENFALSAEAKAMFPYFNSPETATNGERTVFVQAVYENLLNRSVPEDDEGVLYWVGELREGRLSPGRVIGDMIYAAIQIGATDWLTIWNKVQVAEYFTEMFQAKGRVWMDSDLDLARQALQDVTDDPATVELGKARVDQLLG